MRHVTPMLATIATACALGAPISPAAAQQSSLVGSWTGLWDGFSNGFVEYKITKATSKALTLYYGYKPPGNGATIYELMNCKAVAAGEYNCGASSLSFTSDGAATAVMHARNGHTATATLSR